MWMVKNKEEGWNQWMTRHEFQSFDTSSIKFYLGTVSGRCIQTMPRRRGTSKGIRYWKKMIQYMVVSVWSSRNDQKQQEGVRRWIFRTCTSTRRYTEYTTIVVSIDGTKPTQKEKEWNTYNMHSQKTRAKQKKKEANATNGYLRHETHNTQATNRTQQLTTIRQLIFLFLPTQSLHFK